MPNDFMALDQNLPRFTGGEGLEERVKRLQDYQYQLLETLRYMMYHLDTRNFNQTELSRFVRTVTDPINARIADTEGNLTELTVTAKGIASRVRDAEGNISTLQQTANAIQTTVSSQAGEISTLRQTADAIQTTVSNQAGEISTLQQTAGLIQTTVSNQAGEISRISQSVDSITLGVSNGDASSTISLYRDGIAISSQNVAFNGMVSFTDLSTEGRSVIYGGNILTETLYLDSLYGNSIYLKDSEGQIATEFRVTGASSATNALDIWARGIRLNSYPGDIYLHAVQGYVTLNGETGVTCANDFYPNRANSYSCGTYGFPWRDIYSQDGAVSSSDERGKTDVDYDMSRYSGLFDRLRPCSFLRTNGTSGRRHHGFIAQEVRAALAAEGMTGKDFAGYVDWEDGGEYGFGLRYEEMLAMVVYEVQEIKKKQNEICKP